MQQHPEVVLEVLEFYASTHGLELPELHSSAFPTPPRSSDDKKYGPTPGATSNGSFIPPRKSSRVYLLIL